MENNNISTTFQQHLNQTQTIMRIYLIPKDFKNSSFIDNEDCPLARAVKRELKTTDVDVDPWELYINDKHFTILNGGFKAEDYFFVKEEYEKDPKMEKAQYYVEIEEVK